jgi:adenylate cyclase
MWLAERLSGFINWPISRKLFLLASVGVFATLLAGVVNLVVFSTLHTSTMDLALLNRYIMAWVPAQALGAALAWPAARAGREGRWAAVLFVMVQSPFIVGLLHLFGTMSTPLVAIYPAIVILWTLVLDERLGLFGLCNLAGWLLAVGVLESRGVLAYAPVMLERSMDQQNNAVWFTAVFFHILVLLSFCISLCVLFQRTRQRQEASLRQAHAALEQSNTLIRRYLPAPLAEQIAAGHYAAASRPERRKLTMLFVGIDGFTSAAEELEPEDLGAVLAQYLSQVVAIADRHDGAVNHVTGDRMLVLFGAPHSAGEREDALRAVRAAREMQRYAEASRKLWSQHGLAQPFGIRIGLNTGYASVGDFGSEGRKLYSGIGLQINLAEHIHDECEAGQVLISLATWGLVQDQFKCAPQVQIAVKDLSYPVRVYALLPETPATEDAAAPAQESPAINGTAVPASPTAVRVWSFANASFDEGSLELFVGDELVELEHKPLEVLRYLLRHAGDVVTKDELLAAVWPGRILSETVIAKSVSRIREVLRDGDQSLIKTVHGFGYRLAAEIRSAPSGGSR